METVDEEVEEEEDEGEHGDVNAYAAAFKNRKVGIASFSCILATIFLLFNEPIISDHLIEIGISENYIGPIFAASCLSYAIAAPLVGYLVTRFSKEALTLFAFTMSSIALLAFGPSKLLGLGPNITLTVGGFIFLGSMEAFIFVPLMPILIEALTEAELSLAKSSKDSDEESGKTPAPVSVPDEEAMSDQASSIFQGAQAVGCIAGPIIGGYLNDLVKFQSTCDFMAVTCALYAVLLYLTMGPSAKASITKDAAKALGSLELGPRKKSEPSAALKQA